MAAQRRERPLARLCFIERVHILSSACMNQSSRFRGTANGLPQRTFDFGTRLRLLEVRRLPAELEVAVRPDDSRQDCTAYQGMLRPRNQQHDRARHVLGRDIRIQVYQVQGEP
jgi:hypothetical protein